MEEKNEEVKYMEVEDKEYYSALQNSLDGYDAKLWQVPGLFFVIIGLLVNGLDKDNFWSSLINGAIFIIASILTGLLLIYYNKAHLFFLLIQEKINDFDKIYNNKVVVIERIPLASMPQEDLISRLACLVKQGRLKIHPIRYLLANFRASSCTRWIMFITLLVNLIIGLIIGLNIIYKR